MGGTATGAERHKGTNAYTFRILGGNYQREALMRAEYYAKK